MLGAGAAAGAIVAGYRPGRRAAPAEAAPAACGAASDRPGDRRIRAARAHDAGPHAASRAARHRRVQADRRRPGRAAPAARRSDQAARPRRPGERRAVLAFGQLTDMHIMDAQSPARVEFLDRFNDPDSPVRRRAAVRCVLPRQEMMTAHVGEAMVQAMNTVRRGPGNRTASGVHHGNRRQRRQHAVQRVALADRPARRRARAAGLRRPHQVRRRCRSRRLRRAVLASGRDAGRADRRPAACPLRLPDRARTARRGAPAVPRDRAAHAVAHRVRQPRRAGPGQHPVVGDHRRGRHGQRQDQQPAARHRHHPSWRSGCWPAIPRRCRPCSAGRPGSSHPTPRAVRCRARRRSPNTSARAAGRTVTATARANLSTGNAYYAFDHGPGAVHRPRHRQPFRWRQRARSTPTNSRG